MSKVAQYANDDIIVCVGFSKASLKQAQSSLYKAITWTKKCGKGGKMEGIMYNYKATC
jgi:hypothetical protein